MKKIVFLFLVSVLIFGCGKDKTAAPGTKHSPARIEEDRRPQASWNNDVKSIEDGLCIDTKFNLQSNYTCVPGIVQTSEYNPQKKDVTNRPYKIAYEKWIPKSGQIEDVIIFVTGRSEFIDKYHQWINYMHEKFPNSLLVIYDHYGQGHSEGQGAHVDSVEVYAHGLYSVVQQLQKDYKDYKVSYSVISHSMGGFVSTVFIGYQAKIFQMKVEEYIKGKFNEEFDKIKGTIDLSKPEEIAKDQNKIKEDLMQSYYKENSLKYIHNFVLISPMFKISTRGIEIEKSQLHGLPYAMKRAGMGDKRFPMPSGMDCGPNDNQWSCIGHPTYSWLNMAVNETFGLLFNDQAKQVFKDISSPDLVKEIQNVSLLTKGYYPKMLVLQPKEDHVVISDASKNVCMRLHEIPIKNADGTTKIIPGPCTYKSYDNQKDDDKKNLRHDLFSSATEEQKKGIVSEIKKFFTPSQGQ